MTSEQPRILLHVQHLLGSGHTRRMAAIARALAEAGAQVLMASGGRPLASLDTGAARLLQLPSLCSADATYSSYLDADDKPIDDAWRTARAARLLTAAENFAPHALLIETFPFGRRMLRFELLPLIERMRTHRPDLRVYGSLRDIIEPPRKAGRAEQTVATVSRDFDAVFVHADADLVTLDASFGLAADIATKLRYTGYVLDDVGTAGDTGDDGHDEVLVSAGGGAAGVDLLACALAAQPLSRAGLRWRLLVAHGVPQAVFAQLRGRAADGVVVERNRADFRSLLARCRLSVSQAGYNTLIEAVVAGARVLAVPFSAAGEQEQGLRAQRFAKAGVLRVLPADTLCAAALAAAVDLAVDDKPATLAVALDGARTTAQSLLADLVLDAATRGCNGPNRPI